MCANALCMVGIQPTDQLRTCLRCGRVGVNAYRSTTPAFGQRGWVCTHEEPCLRRMRVRHRSVARAFEGRPRTSPIAPIDLSERMACVIGSDLGSSEVLAAVLADTAGVEVDRTGPGRRALDLVRRSDYGVVVVDVHPEDSVAFLNELARRLGAARRRGVATVVVQAPGPSSPAIEFLCAATRAVRLHRPFDADDLMAAVGQAAGTMVGQAVAG